MSLYEFLVNRLVDVQAVNFQVGRRGLSSIRFSTARTIRQVQQFFSEAKQLTQWTGDKNTPQLRAVVKGKQYRLISFLHSVEIARRDLKIALWLMRTCRP